MARLSSSTVQSPISFQYGPTIWTCLQRQSSSICRGFLGLDFQHCSINRTCLPFVLGLRNKSSIAPINLRRSQSAAEIQRNTQYCRFEALALICLKEKGKMLAGRKCYRGKYAHPPYEVGQCKRASLLVELLKRWYVFKSLSVAMHASAISL